MNLTSAHNPFLKSIRYALSHGRPTDDGLIVAEGPHLLEEALNSRWSIQTVITTPSGLTQFDSLIGRTRADVIQVPASVFDRVASTESARQVLCLLRPKPSSWSQLITTPALVVVLDGIQDPGNAGTIARSAEAFGASGLALLSGSVRLANSKFLRASAGSAFRLPILESVPVDEALSRLAASQIPIYSLSADGTESIRNAPLSRPIALVVGNEGAGVSAAMRATSKSLSIPTGRVESLNAAIACTLALYEAHHQRLSSAD